MKRISSTDFNQHRKGHNEEVVMIMRGNIPDKVLMRIGIYDQIKNILVDYYWCNREVLETAQLVYLKDILKVLECPEGSIEE